MWLFNLVQFVTWHLSTVPQLIERASMWLRCKVRVLVGLVTCGRFFLVFHISIVGVHLLTWQHNIAAFWRWVQVKQKGLWREQYLRWCCPIHCFKGLVEGLSSINRFDLQCTHWMAVVACTVAQHSAAWSGYFFVFAAAQHVDPSQKVLKLSGWHVSPYWVTHTFCYSKSYSETWSCWFTSAVAFQALKSSHES